MTNLKNLGDNFIKKMSTFLGEIFSRKNQSFPIQNNIKFLSFSHI